MQLEKGCVVKSISGRDAGRFYVVMEIGKQGVLICDGKVHKLEKPKRKNPKHLAPTRSMADVTELTTNNQLKRVLREFNALAE